jgi:hypothetical protein
VNTSPTLNRTKRVVYAFVGLLGGEAALLLFLLQNAYRLRTYLLTTHIGQPARQIPLAFEMFCIYAVFSFAGWLLLGLPTALIFPARLITGLPWILRLLLGAALGPLALFLIFLLLAHGHLEFPATFRGMGVEWGYSILVSTVSFVLYGAMLGKKGSLSIPHDPRVSGRIVG